MSFSTSPRSTLTSRGADPVGGQRPGGDPPAQGPGGDADMLGRVGEAHPRCVFHDVLCAK
jgi:hypothetical protein